MCPTIAQYKTGSNDSQFSLFLANFKRVFNLRGVASLAVATIPLSASTLSPFLVAYQSLPVKYPQLDCRMDILLVHETLAPLPLISKPQASLLIEASFATVELGLLVLLSSSLLPSQVG